LYMGWYDADVSGPFAQPTVEFMPGAFAYHLHSTSAETLRSTTLHWVGPLLAKGATASMGCVYEPYLGGTPEVAIFVARWIYQAFTFGEAAYASQPVLSWQTTVVGDPLYRPFSKNADLLHRELAVKHSKMLEWSFLRLVNLNLVMGKPMASVVQLLEELDLTKKSAVLTEKLGDLYTAQGKPSSAVHEYTQALGLGPSPEQRLRLRLTLGDRLLVLDRTAEAYADYQKLLEELPAYPDKLAIYKKLLPLAQKLNKTEDAETYQAEITRLTPPPAKPASGSQP
jgi:tetratricopeptide (TPR) repeat protein